MSGEKEFFCTEAAWEHGVPLIGTATRGDIWLLIEYAGRWGAKAFEESTIQNRVKNYLLGLEAPDLKIRILLIKQAESRHKDGISFFIGQTDSNAPRLYKYRLNSYLDILDLNLNALLEKNFADPIALRTDPLYLVCTNGVRDKCCAVYGPQVFQAVKQSVGEAVWQSSHIGGHNQAPILLIFPHGVNYGQATPSEAQRLVEAYQREAVVLHHYRGRVCFEPPIQAAEHFWRLETGNLALSNLRIDNVDVLADDEWVVTVAQMDGSQTKHIHLQRRASDYSIPITCTQKKESQIFTFHQLDD